MTPEERVRVAAIRVREARIGAGSFTAQDFVFLLDLLERTEAERERMAALQEPAERLLRWAAKPGWPEEAVNGFVAAYRDLTVALRKHDANQGV